MAQFKIQRIFQQALQHHQAGRLQEAEQLYRQILTEQPTNADAMHNLGALAQQMGRNNVAVELFRRAIALNPNDADAYCNLGNTLKDQGQFNEAIANYRQAISLKPHLPEAYNYLGVALNAKGEIDEAIAAYRQAIALKPHYAEAHGNLGSSLRRKGRIDEAIAAFRQTIALSPQLSEAYSNLGNLLIAKGQLDEAIAAFRQAIALKPNLAEAYSNLGIPLRHKGRIDEATAAFRQAIALKPNYAEAHSNLGHVMKDQGQLDEAVACYRQAMALAPHSPEFHSNLIYTLLYHPGYDARAIAAELAHWNRKHAQPMQKWIRPHSNDRAPDRQLRIGYVSPDSRDHVVGRNLLPLFAHHDRRQFEIFCYANVSRPDAVTAQFQKNADVWRSTAGVSDERMDQQIREDRIDILVDLTLHLGGSRLLVFARKPAPVQVTFAGYPGSTGLTAIDYRLSDAYLDPPGSDESVNSEKTICLPDSFWCYDPANCRDIPVNSLPMMSSGWVTFGCLNNFCKVNDEVLSLWTSVLKQVENSQMLLLADPGNHRQRTVQRLQQEGIDPGRIRFIPKLPRRAYLESYHQIDIGLDSFPYNGHTTSLDSFWMGVPVVTLVGHSAISRAGWCQLSNLGLPELAAQTRDQYVQIATQLATHPPRLADLRAHLRQRMEQSPLMNAPKFARNIEAAYRQMWRTWCTAV